jgi:hypothetical protein
LKAGLLVPRLLSHTASCTSNSIIDDAVGEEFRRGQEEGAPDRKADEFTLQPLILWQLSVILWLISASLPIVG